MRLIFDPSSVQSYRMFLAAKSLPKYRFIGRTVEFPDEYANRLGYRVGTDAVAPYFPAPGLFDYQRDVAALAVRKRKLGVFMEPGLGKTFIEAEFARHAASVLPADRRCVLWLAPLMVVPQTLAEIERFYGGDLRVEQLRAKDLPAWLSGGKSRIGITNYEGLKNDTPTGRLGALILDESSMLKSAYGKWGQTCIRLGRGLDWKLAATGTPAPNDRIEYANHAVFLDQEPTVNSFLARYFVNRGQTQNRWELKPHALRPFYLSLSHWSIFVSDPGVYGWQDNAGTLPPIHVHIHDVPLTEPQQNAVAVHVGGLYGKGQSVGGITRRSVLSQIAKGHLRGQDIPTAKPDYVRGLIASWPEESTLVWCHYNREQDLIERALPGAASIRGETPYAERARMLADFQAGLVRVLISKPDILGMGLNLQVATRQVFSGLQDSYEEYFQAVKRSNRVGSTKPLNVHIPVTEIERPMVDNVLRKADRVEADTRQQEQMFKEAMSQGLLKGLIHAVA